jgi:hypothetical protein
MSITRLKCLRERTFVEVGPPIVGVARRLKVLAIAEQVIE